MTISGKPYQIMKAAGICVGCVLRWALSGAIYCEMCAVIQKREKQERRLRRIAARLCVECATTVGEFLMCDDCREKADRRSRASSNQQERRNKWLRNNPHKVRALEFAKWAEKLGLITVSKVCEHPDCTEPTTDKHHNLGYAPEHWGDVQGLCRAHHNVTKRRIAV